MYRKASYIAARIAGLIAILLMGCIVAIQTPYVQTRLSRFAIGKVTAALEGRVSYDELKIMPSGVLMLKNAVITDANPYVDSSFTEAVDTIFRAGTITATFTVSGLFRGEGLHIGRVGIEDAFFHLVIEPGEYGMNISRVFKIESPTERPAPGPDIFDIRTLSISNFRYRMSDYTEDGFDYSGHGIDYGDLDATVINLRAHSLKFTGSRMYAVADRVSITEKSGYVINNISGRVAVGQGKTMIEDLHLVDPWSDVHLKFYSMNYDTHDAFSDYIEKVRMEGRFRRSSLSMKTITYFSGALPGIGTTLDISEGRVKGYVNDLSVEGLVFRDPDTGISARFDGSAIGMPDMEKMMVDAQLDELTFTTDGLSRFLAEWMPGSAPDLRAYGKGVRFRVDAKASGHLNRLNAELKLSSNAGSLGASAELRNLIDKSRAMEAALQLNTDRLDIGSIAGIGIVGECDLYTRAEAILPRHGAPEILLDTLSIGRLEALDDQFMDIRASGSFKDGSARGHLTSNDPKLKLSLRAAVDLPQKDGFGRYRMAGSITNADLIALKIDTRGTRSNAAIDLQGDISVNGWDMRGDVFLNNVRLENDEGEKNVGDIRFKAYRDGGSQCYNISAPFLDLFMSGSGTIPQFLADIQNISTRRDLPALYTGRDEISGSGKYELDMVFHDSRELLSFAMPGLYISDSTRVTISVEDGGRLNGSLSSSRLAYETNFLKDAYLQFDNEDNSLNASVSGKLLRAGNFEVEHPSLNAFADDNEFSIGLKFDGFSGAGGSGALYMDGMVSRDSLGVLVIQAHPLDSYVAAGEDVWSLGESDIILSGQDLHVRDFNVSNGGQRLAVDGSVTKSSSDTLSLSLEDIDLRVIDEFLPKKFGIEGRAGGKAYLVSGEDRLSGISLDFGIDSIRVGGVGAGDIKIAGILDDRSDDFKLFVRNEMDGRTSLDINGLYFLDDGRVDAFARFDGFPLSIAESFVSGIFGTVGGSISGGIRIQGQPGHMSTSSDDLFLNDAVIQPAFTGVTYTVRGPLRVDDSGLYFDMLDISDGASGKGSLAGAIHYDHLNDMRLDSRLTLDNIKVVDALEKGGNAIYGLLRASGSASVKGPFNALDIDANIVTSGTGNIHIPTSNSLSGGTSNLLTFTRPVVQDTDPYEEMLVSYRTRTARESDMNIQARLTAQPGVTAYVEMDKSTGNVASFSGAGSVNLHMRPSRAIFDLTGDYNISEGKYQFVVPGILSREFEIQDGSSIKFGGDLMDSELDINALYRLKTSLSTLIADTTSVSTRRIVECGLNISDRLRNPRLDFSIEIPDLDPTTKSQVETALGTSDKVQKQFLALLLMGSFLPDEASGIVNGSDILLSNVTELMSNQLNSILQKLDIPLDVGIGYQGTSGGTNIFDVAISTQLFNNKVIVGGSVGNRQYSHSSGANGDMVGDLDIQIKLDQEGKFRLNMFSHSANEYSSYLDYSQRNGVGVSYQKSYNRFGDFVKSIFAPRKSREDKEKERETDKEQVVIRIEDEQRKTVSDTVSVGR